MHGQIPIPAMIHYRMGAALAADLALLSSNRKQSHSAMDFPGNCSDDYLKVNYWFNQSTAIVT